MHLPPAGFDRLVRQLLDLAQGVDGHLTEREIRLLCLAVVANEAPGEVLEIGSYLGKSTVILAKCAGFAGLDRVVAVDPLTLPAETDPRMERADTLPERFRENLRRHGVDSVVEFHQTTSNEVARAWTRPIRMLWIDGDHTLAGTSDDFEGFLPHLSPGAIVAMHDVLHGCEGPVSVMCERLLPSDAFGACGVCGSIGWGQYLGGGTATREQRARKAGLLRSLRRLLPHVRPGPGARVGGLSYKIKRALVPHGRITPAQWVRLLAPVRP